ncbi:MAG: glutamine--fructose-6-phosphate transaminase (isomerizing) [SAR86 cluster bacterium]|uniref:Glutamine--fructose-6-phosphate aminotransferase [isomerizing] n=1 Tax=SAR86 cluster bacterium TaxID=2030880 RepID=A0A2A4MTJ7_9GAMM|nr:MAG: glutamine--fructose-6-phosphate transaminase (isomerizing) [SAR86 cluster bacterium]
MCGIVGAIAQRDVSGILIEGLKRLEYRGYDSAGMALIAASSDKIETVKAVGKVEKLISALAESGNTGQLGIAHTRWATHGKATIENAHPHNSADEISLVHNGILENHQVLKDELLKSGYVFNTQTDTEVIVHLIHQARQQSNCSLVEAVQKTITRLTGTYGLCVIEKTSANKIVVARSGSPLVIGVGIGENFIASDVIALGQVTDRFIHLEEGDVAEISLTEIKIWQQGERIERELTTISSGERDVSKGKYSHYMLKEIFEQPSVIRATLQGRITEDKVLEQAFGVDASAIFDQIKHVQIVACGTSHHAGEIAKYWLESIAKIPCQVDIASDYRYRNIIVQPGTLFVSISQSGETADTLAALRFAKKSGYVSCLAICNVATSSLVRESDFSLLTMAGQEIGVASTKAFTTQLCVLLILTITLARRTGLSVDAEAELIRQFNELPELITATLALDAQIKEMSIQFANKHHALFLGRGIEYPVAKEGALKLKEISYIHAEAYPAGELKHGPLALVDEDMPVVAVAPNNELLDKLSSNLSLVSSRGGKLYVFADESIKFSSHKDCEVIHVPKSPNVLDPIVFTIPLQLLSYHVAMLKGTDIDQPRNLAKSVTVE